MTTDSDRIALAEEQVERTRERLLDTVQLLIDQLEPRRLLRELWQDAKVKGADLAEEAVDAVKARPLTATGVVAALAMFLAREPIADLVGKVLGGSKHRRSAKKGKANATGALPAKTGKRKSAATPAPRKQTEKTS